VSGFSQITDAPLTTRMRWYADLNCYRAPADFPLALPAIEGHAAKHDNGIWHLAWRTVSSSLPEAESSLGWWVNELGKTPGEWRAWWRGRKECDQAAADEALAAFAGETA